MILQFTKMHGLGNDFVMIDNLDDAITLTPEQVRFLCDRHFGIGADGVILMESREDVDCFMNYINADGSLAEMCGNGIRCTAEFFKVKTSSEKKILNVGTRSGIKEIICHNDDTYSVTMARPVFSHSDFPNDPINIDGFSFECVSVGNPHAIAFVDNVNDIDLLSLGPRVEYDSYFPNKINVHFVEKLSDDKLKMRIWERSCGPTLACGTGASAVYALAHKKGIINDEITINLPGGDLIMSENKNGEVIMRGPAVSVFESEITI